MHPFARTLLSVSVVAVVAPAAMAACSSSEGGQAGPTDAGKAESAPADGGKTPSTKTSSTPSSQPSTKPAPKPSTSATAPKSEPPPSPPKSSDLESSELLRESGYDWEAPCAKAGLSEGKGYCLENSLIGCVGGKLLGIDCDMLGGSSLLTMCDDSTGKAGCYGVDLAPVLPDVTNDAKAYGLTSASCKESQEGRGFCWDTFVVVCTDRQLQVLDCKSYTDGVSCRANSDGVLSCF